ncbi:hypothetical protein ColTof4_12745 [Colletotrichum tofieldiae]|nr:hypothetical protein ColTof3_14423 [Colletotrichum tofieldiae]GKT80322.1 hypothetical protein ColTof4_12745 [Colletotrichum tofieldiae]
MNATLSDAVRTMRFNVVSSKVQKIRKEINRIRDLVPDEEFATFVAEIPISNDPDWNLLETPPSDGWNVWAAWDDSEGITTESDVCSPPRPTRRPT